ncbi:SDR family oxidoreductase [Bacillus sp. USDA818B3_A]|uniref:SDR family oxidoreductase n=1 Tax=Bacillus sp. USDA818B3_A TaxID=2698834 RepID=UPI00137157F7|nr:SDR family oxidoreductase [Bacillus sp. USDA818B3_A]
MKVFVVGANGKIGKHLVQMLSETTKHTVKAMVRKEEQAKFLQAKGIETAIINLEDSVDKIAGGAKGCDAIVFTAGSGGHTGADKTLLVDLDGAVKTIEAAAQAKIKRFIMVSALQAHRRENWSEAIKPYYVAKSYADKMLEQSNLTYTIIRPGGLLDSAGTGNILVAEDIKSGTISREDVAKTIISSLDEGNTFYKAFDLVSGEIPITEALKLV